MAKSFSNKIFGVGFGVGFVSFVLISQYIDRSGRGICFDCAEKFGYPFYYLETGGAAFDSRYLWGGIALDLLAASFVGLASGLLISSIYSHLFQHNDKLD